jgi:hypothetical protein
MRKRHQFALLFLLAAFLVLLAWLVLQPREPVYRGKPVSYWIDRAGQDVPGADYFPKVDSNAIPYLVKALKRRTGPLPEIYSKIRTNSPAFVRRRLRVLLPVTAWKVRAGAAQVLGRIGTNSAPAISGLLRVLKEEDAALVRVSAVESLQNIGRGNDTVLKAIIAALQDKAPEVRDAAGDALWQLDPATAKTLLK